MSNGFYINCLNKSLIQLKATINSLEKVPEDVPDEILDHISNELQYIIEKSIKGIKYATVAKHIK